MKILKNPSNLPSLAGLYILSAVRTPNGVFNGALSEFTAPQLGSFAIREALQRAAVPPTDLENVFMDCVSHDDCQAEVIKRAGLSRITRVSVFPTGNMKGFSEAVKFLVRDGKVCAAGKMESVTKSFDSKSYQNFLKLAQKDSMKLIKSNLVNPEDRKEFEEQNYSNFIQAARSGAFSEEIAKIDFWKKGQKIFVGNDEISSDSNLSERDLVASQGDGATAIILSTKEYARLNKLVPLAKVVSYTEGFVNANDLTSAQLLAIEKALEGARCKSDDVSRWEMVSVINDTIIKCKNYLNIQPTKLNKDGSILDLEYPIGLTGIRAVCHLVHSLSAEELGCVACCDFETASAVVVQKMGVKKSSKPQLTLYKKQACTLCDEMKARLHEFKNQCSVVEIDIEEREGEKYKELYQYEIPVLFLDGIFLCKHTLDVESFKRRLKEAEESD